MIKYRTDLDALAAYRPGPPAPQREVPTYKLSSNENPYPPLPSVQQAIAAAIGAINRYPDMAARELIQALADRFGVDPGEVIIGAGSVEVASAIIRATAGAGDEVVFAWRSFEAYPQLVIAAGATPVAVPLADGFHHDFAALAAAVNERTRLVLVCNPNNPTGVVCHQDELEELLRQVPVDVTVVLDEAYCHFDTDPDSPRGADLFGRYPNLVVCHTFSKAYGLAGLRLGYALAPAGLADQIRKVSLPFGVTNLAQQAGLASLAAESELDQRVAQIVARRDRIERALAEQGWQLPKSEANFIWLPVGATEAAQEIMDRYGLVGRVFAGEGIRISIGEAESLEPLIAAAAEIKALT